VLKGRRRLKKALKAKKTRGKKTTQETRGNRIYEPYSILTHLVVGNEHHQH